MSKFQPTGGTQFIRYFGPLLDALRKLGGSGTVAEVVEQIAADLEVPDHLQQELLGSGTPRFQNQIQWARLYLYKAGLLTDSKRGVWTLSEIGSNTTLSPEAGKELFQKLSRKFADDRKKKSPKPLSGDAELGIPDPDEAPAVPNHRDHLLSLLKSLPPDGFERFCQALLRESGFTEVKVTGKSGDGGIDGWGTLEVNPLVNFKVLFQCKRYKDSVSSDKVRDFRGAMQGRADKGIILTTGIFTTDSRNEANRDGVPPIELIDGQKLIHLCESLEFGLKPVKAFEVDERFFEKFDGKAL